MQDRNVANEAKREGHIHTALYRQSKLIEDIFTSIDNLEHRFERVLRPSPPTKDGLDGPRVAEVLAPLAIDINASNDRLEAILAALVHLRDRCEI
jgi:hypothetical protein